MSQEIKIQKYGKGNLIEGFINLYQYKPNGRIFSGTGVYPTKEEADRVAKHKKNRLICVFICKYWEPK